MSLEEVTPATEIKMETIKINALLLGPSGSGKTTSATTLPGKKLVLDLDNRAESLSGFKDIDILRFSRADKDPWLKLLNTGNEVWEAVEDGTFGYEALIIDGLTQMNRIAMYWALQLRTKKGELMARGPGDVPAQEHYNPQMWNLAEFCLKMLPLPKIHVLITGHVDIFENAKTKEIYMAPKLYGKTRTEISNWFNETYYCEYSSQMKEYLWRTKPTSKMPFVKSAMNQLGKFWEDPITVDFDEEKVGFQKLLDLRYGKEVKKKKT